MKFFDKLFPKKTEKTQKKANNANGGIPKEVLDKLPPGVKIKRIEIGPKQIVRGVLYLILAFWMLSILRQVLLPQDLVNVSLSEAIMAIKKDQASQVTVSDNDIMVTLKDGGKVLMASKEPATSLAEILQREGIDLSTMKLIVQNNQGWKTLGDILSIVLTIGLPIAFIVWFFGRQSGGGAGGMFGFGKSTAKLFIKGKQNLTFKDVAGVDEAKREFILVRGIGRSIKEHLINVIYFTG